MTTLIDYLLYNCPFYRKLLFKGQNCISFVLTLTYTDQRRVHFMSVTFLRPIRERMMLPFIFLNNSNKPNWGGHAFSIKLEGKVIYFNDNCNFILGN